MFWPKKAILAKIESAYGTDAVPIGGANAMIVTEFRITPIAGDQVSRNLERPYLGAQEELLTGQHVECSFKVEIAGAGAGAAGPDTPPAWGPLVRACAHAETITADTSVAYTPISDGLESVTIYTNLDGIQHKLLGARGTFSVQFTAKELPYFSFTYRGLLVAPTAVALPTVDTTAFATPLIVNDANTDFLVAASARIMRSFSLDMSGQLAGRFLVGQEEIIIGDRPGSGQMVISAVPLATYNPFAAALARTPTALQLVHGTVAQNIVTIDVGQGQIRKDIQIGQTDNITEWTVPYLALPTDAGNDDWSITCT
ncbi:phage tail tube protein [Thalassobaculum sp.]|uniref:phage tail tube protein n=1 Tax=Thalassobaculum sp. TaxID=2022740 RepID=UPI0032EAE97D